MNIVEIILQVLITTVLFIVNLILLPIDTLIASVFPDLSGVFTSIGTYLETIFTHMGFVLSITGLPPAVIALVIAFLVFKLTLPINVWLIKLAVGWWHKLKP